MKQRPSSPRNLFWSVMICLSLLMIHSHAGGQTSIAAVLIIAHRGGLYRGIPENTLPNFKKAISQGIDIIEVDIRTSRDGKMVIIHDATLDRTTDGSGNISDYTLAELKKLDAGSGEKIPTFEEVLRLVKNTRVNLLLDIKKGPLLEIGNVIAIAEKYQYTDHIIAGVRSLEDLISLKKLNPSVRTLGFVGKQEQIQSYIAAGADAVRLWPDWIEKDARLISSILEKNVPVWVTVADLSQKALDHLIDCGVSGFITDYPEKLRMMLENRGK